MIFFEDVIVGEMFYNVSVFVCVSEIVFVEVEDDMIGFLFYTFCHEAYLMFSVIVWDQYIFIYFDVFGEAFLDSWLVGVVSLVFLDFFLDIAFVEVTTWALVRES